MLLLFYLSDLFFHSSAFRPGGFLWFVCTLLVYNYFVTSVVTLEFTENIFNFAIQVIMYYFAKRSLFVKRPLQQYAIVFKYPCETGSRTHSNIKIDSVQDLNLKWHHICIQSHLHSVCPLNHLQIICNAYCNATAS